MGDRITKVRPGPRDCPFRGVPYPVHEARIADLFALQSWVDARWPDPLDDLPAAAAVPIGTERDRALFDLYDAAGEGPPCFDDPDGSALLLGTDGGIEAFLSVALRRGSPGLTPDGYARLTAAVAAGEASGWFRSVQAAFYGSDPARAVADALGVPRGRGRGEPVTWGEAIDALSRSHGWTYPDVEALSLSEFVNARRGGKPRDEGFAGLTPAETEAWRARVAAARGWDQATGGPDAGT